MNRSRLLEFSSPSRTLAFVQVVLGSLYLAALSQLEIPLVPVPVTMHTFALMTLALYSGKEKAALSAGLYLAYATMGLPVFPGLYCDPLWMLSPSAGFLISFPFAAYLIGYISECRVRSFALKTALSLGAGLFLIYFCGVLWLSFLMGINGALAAGLYPFIPMELGKIGAALSLTMAMRRFKD